MERVRICNKCGRTLSEAEVVVVEGYYYCEKCAKKEREYIIQRDQIREMFKKPQIRHTSAANLRIGGKRPTSAKS